MKWNGMRLLGQHVCSLFCASPPMAHEMQSVALLMILECGAEETRSTAVDEDFPRLHFCEVIEGNFGGRLDAEDREMRKAA